MKNKNLNSTSSVPFKSPYVSDFPLSNIFLVSYPKFATNKSMREYSTSYQAAIDVILEPLFMKGSSEAIDDLLLLPVLFLWRQVLELELKRFLYILDYRINQNNTFEIHHDLSKLYIKIVPLLKLSNLPVKAVSDFRAFKKLIDFYHYYDPGSYSFRYPQDLKQQITNFNQSQQYIDVETLDKHIKELVNFIGYCEYTFEEMYENTVD